MDDGLCTTLSEFKSLMADSSKLMLTNELEEIVLNTDELRARNRELLIEKLERVVQEKNASIVKLEEREQHLEDTLQKRNSEFYILEEKLRQFEEKTQTFEQLHQLQVQTFEKTIRDCQIENERLCEHIHDLTREVTEKTSFDAINHEKIQTFDRIAADVQLWRQKLDSYKATVEQREETINNLKKEITDLHRRKQTNGDFEDNSALRVQIVNLQKTVRDRENDIENLKLTLCRVRDTLQPGQLSQDNRWRSCSENIGRTVSQEARSVSPPARRTSSPLDVELMKKNFSNLSNRFTNVQQQLVKRDDQILTLKKVHDKRWLRLKHLQKQYRSLKDELQSYADDEAAQNKSIKDYSYRRAVHRTKNSCSVCQDQAWRKQRGMNKKGLQQEDDDHVWNEMTKLKREHTRLMNENLSLNEKVDLQEVEINEQTIVIDELRNEIQRLNQKDERVSPVPPPHTTYNNEDRHLIEKLDQRLFELESERTSLVFEHERLKTTLDLCLDEKKHLVQEKSQSNSEVKKLKLRILQLQDQIHRLKRNATKESINPRILIIKKRIMQKKSRRTKTCLEMLLDQNSTLIDDLQNESLISNRRNNQHRNEHLPMKSRQRQLSMSSITSNKRYRPLKRNCMGQHRLPTMLAHHNVPRKSSTPSIRISTLRKQNEQLEADLAAAREDNEHLNQHLTTTLSRITILKTTNQKLLTECDQARNNRPAQSNNLNHEQASFDNHTNIDHLYDRLRNTSFDAAQQRKLNKALQTENELLNKNLQTLAEKLTHTERDMASKRLLIESYKARISEMENNVNCSNENDGERLKSLTETGEKLRASIDSYKNRLHAITRDKHDLDARYTQLTDEHQKLKTRFEDVQTKSRLTDQQLRQLRSSTEQLNDELVKSRHVSEQQLLTLNNQSQESLRKITVELNRALQRLNEYERFINALLHEMIRRSVKMTEQVKRAREHQKQRESLSVTLPGYDSALHTASKILNLTQDDLDELMSVADDSFRASVKGEDVDRNEKIRQKVSKLLVSDEECAGKLLKIFSKKLDEMQADDRELIMVSKS